MMRTRRPVLGLIAGALAAGTIVSCDDPTRPPTTGAITPRIAYLQPDSSTRASLVLPLTNVRARLFGPTPQTKDLALTGSVWTGSFTGLEAGTYEVVIEGIANGQTQFYGRTATITVARGQSASPLIPFAAAIPDVTQPPLANSTSFSQRIPFRAVAAATGYVVEWSQDSSFLSGSTSLLTAATDTTPLIQVNATGRWFVRSKAQLPQVLATSLPYATPRGWNVNVASGGNNAAGANPTTLAPQAPQLVTARNIAPNKQFDFFDVLLRAGDSLIVETRAARLDPASPLNTVVQLFRNDGTTTVGAAADDFGSTTDSRLAIQVANTEVHKLRVAGTSNTVGHYEVSIEIRRLPAAPTGLVVGLTSGTSASLTWTDNADNETGFVVQRCAGSACTTFATVDTVAAGATSYTDAALTVNTQYRWRVRAKNVVGLSNATNIVEAGTFVPTAPTNFVATTISGTQINLTWTDVADNEATYRVERCAIATCQPTDFAEIASVPAGSTSYNDVGATVDNSYSYRVRGVNAVGAGTFSAVASANTIRPAAPTALVVTTRSATRVDLTWTETATNESGFRIERCTGEACTEFAALSTVAANITAFSDLTVAVGNFYRYRVVATNVAGASAPTNIGLADVRTPAAPTTLTATTSSGTRIDLAWTNTAVNADSISVRRCTGNACDTFAEVAVLAPTAAVYADQSVTIGNVYRYQVIARNVVGNSPASNTVQAATVLATAPTTLSAVTVSATRVDLTWTDNAANETGFQVERCEGACTQFDSLATAAINATTFTDLTAVVGKAYQYRVAARNIVGLSAYTNTANASTQLPAAPTNLAVAITSATAVQLSWTDVAINEGDYVVERCAGAGCTTFAEVTTAAANATGVANSGLVQGTTYLFRVRARNSAGVSDAAGPVTVVLDVPAAVTALRGQVLTTTSARLTWTYTGVNPLGFRVQRCEGAACVNFAQVGGAIAQGQVSLDITGLTAAATYRYRLVAVNAIGESAPGNVVDITVSGPAAPANLGAVTISAAQIDLTWTDESNNEDNFVLERCTGAACTTFATLVTAPAGTTTHSDATVVLGNVYRYRVRATNLLGASANSSIAEASTILPAAPTTLAAQTISRTEVALTWTDNANNESGFQVERCTGAACTNFVQVGAAGVNAAAFNDQSVQPDSRFRFRVRAFNAAGASAYTNVVEAATDIPIDPTNLGAVAQSATSIRLNWSDNSNNEIGFIVNRCQGVGCTELQPVAQVATNVATYLDPTAVADAWYSYSVVAFNSGSSRATNVATTNTFLPQAPSELVATAASGSRVALTWTDGSNNELRFRIERCLGENCTTFDSLATVGANIATYSDTTATINNTYRYRVRADNNVGVSAFASVAQANTILPNAPTGLGAQTLSASAINVVWVDQSLNEQGYRIERCVGENCTDFVARATVDPNNVLFQDDQVIIGTIYRYRVAAFNVAGASNFAGPVRATTILPADPAALSAVIVSSARIDVSWNDLADNEAGYRVERCTNIGCSNFAEIGAAPANATSFSNIVGVAQNQFYSYRIRAFNASGTSGFVGPISLSTFLPASPTDLLTTPVLGNQVNLSWTDVAVNEAGFRIERCTGDGCSNYAVIDSVGANIVAFSDQTTVAGGSYRYRVVAFNGIGTSTPSNVATVSTLTPSAPTVLVATTQSDTQILLGWADNSANENGFTVERCAGVACSAFATIATLPANSGGTASYLDATPIAEVAYRYRVRAFIVAASEWSSVAEATTIRPAAPTALVATSLSDTRIDLAWTDNSNNELAFVVERCAGDGCTTWATDATLATNTTSYSSTNLQSGGTYRFRVRASNGAGGSAFTEIAQALTNLPAIPTTLVATALNGTDIQLSWTDNAVGETSYIVQRCAGNACTNFTDLVTLGINAAAHVDLAIAVPGVYRYRVAARNSAGTSGFSNISTASTATPGAPSTLIATTTSATTIALAWTDNADNEANFLIERCTGAACNTFAQIASIGANLGAYIDATAVVGNDYTYQVRASGITGNSAYSNTATASTVLPTVPTTLVAATVSAARIDLTWVNTATNAASIRIERCLGAICTNFGEVASLNPSVTTYVNDGLASASLFRYQIRAANAAGFSAYTAIVQASTNLPAAASELVATATSPTQVSLTWTDNSSDETSFRIQRCEGVDCSGVAFTEVGNVGANITSFADTTVILGRVYRYRVLTQNVIGLSPPSTIAETNTNLPLAPASITTQVTGPRSARLTWSNTTANRTGVQIQRCAGESCTNYALLATVGVSATDYLDTTGDSGSVMRYQLRTVSPVGVSSFSAPASARLLVPTALASLVGVSVTVDGADLTWSNVSDGATGQVVERCLGDGCTNFAALETLAISLSTYSDRNLTPGAIYRYRVVATNPVGRAPVSNLVRVRLLPPLTPTGALAATVTGSRIDVTWVDASDDELGYRVERCFNVNCTTFSQIASVGPNLATSSDLGVALNTSYSYRVRAFNAVGFSGFSNVTTANTFVPAAPAALLASPITGQQVNLTWTDSATNETRYLVDRCAPAGCVNFTTIDSLPAGAVAYQDVTAAFGQTYSYRVRALNLAGASAPSNVSNASTVLAAATNVRATTLNRNTIRLTWFHNSPIETGYRIERCAGDGCVNFSPVTTIGPNFSSFDNSALTQSVSYSYRVVPVTAGGEAVASPVAGARAPRVLGSGLVVTAQSDTTAGERHYVLSVPAGTRELVVQMTNGTVGTGDGDMWVKFGSVPNIQTGPLNTATDCTPYVGGNNETCVIQNPAAGDWFIMIHGFSAYSGATIEAVTPGDLIVFNDINALDVTGMANVNNQQLVANFLSFTNAGTRAVGNRVTIDFGRLNPAGSGTAASLRAFIQARGFIVDTLLTTSGTLFTPTTASKVLILYMPRIDFTAAEIDVIRTYIRRGGRVVLIGDSGAYYGLTGIATMNLLLSALGSTMTHNSLNYDAGFVTLAADRLRADPVTSGLTGLLWAYGGGLNLGVGDKALVYESTNTVPWVARARVTFP